MQAADFGLEISGVPQGHRRVVRARRKHPIVEKPSDRASDGNSCHAFETLANKE